MRISETFSSIQGEGQWLGVPSIFLRLSGCNLRCSWCDTPYASWNAEGRETTMEELLTEFKKWPNVKHLVITGGEPFIFPELPEWVSHFKDLGYVITIETAGTIWRATQADLISISPKLKNSTPDCHEHPKISQRHEKSRINLEALANFIQQHNSQLKFVLEENDGLTEVYELLESLPTIAKENIYLMPQTQDKDYSKVMQSLIDIAMENGFRVTPRLQIAIWGNKRAT